MNYIVLVVLLSLALGLPYSLRADEWQLQLVQILFRNGLSAPVELYPNDPNNADAWEEGLGQLTLVGQKQLYALGRELKKRYSHYLSSNPHELKVQSTYLDECMTSALCLLASLYEPDPSWMFVPGLNWQPIPVKYEAPHIDRILAPITNFVNIAQEVSPLIEKELEKYKLQLKYWTLYSGMTVKDCYQVSTLHNILSAEYFSNQTIPDWAWKYWKDLQSLNNYLHTVAFSEPTTLNVVGGPLLYQMVKNAAYKVEGRINQTKIFIYSGQSFHVAAVLGALQSFNGKEPPFAAAILMELFKVRHDNKTDAGYGIRFSYFNETGAHLKIGSPTRLMFPGCTEICPLHVLANYTMQWRRAASRFPRSTEL